MRPIIASSPSQKVAAKATFRHSASSPSDSQIGSYHRAMVGADHRAARTLPDNILMLLKRRQSEIFRCSFPEAQSSPSSSDESA